MLFTGNVMLGAFFLAPDSSSSPVQPAAMWIYGFGAGVLAMLIRVYGHYYDGGVAFGILLMNLAAPLLDKIRPKTLGRE
jgi:electron transport complex protein RnfD